MTIKKNPVIVMLGLSLLLAPSLSSILQQVNGGCLSEEYGKVISTDAGKYTAHLPIRINGDFEFTEKNGVVCGDGTASSPYVISGWDIDAHGAGCSIYIGNTTSYFVIENCRLYNTSFHDYQYSPGCGIELYNVMNGDIVNNTVYSNRYGVYLTCRCSNNRIGNNTIHHNTCYGICMESSSGNVIFNNDIHHNSNHGISLSSTGDNVISNNNVHNNSFSGIYLNSYSARNVISNNSIHHNSKDGIHAFAYFSTIVDNLIFNNTIHSNSGSGIFLEGSDHNIISNNSIYNNSLNGIELYAYESWVYNNRNVIFNNTICNNPHNGISMNSFNSHNLCDNNMIFNNTIHNNGMTGIYMYAWVYASCSYNIIFNNNIFNNGDGGVHIIGSAYYNTIYWNLFRHNHNSGDSFHTSRIQACDGGRNNRWNSSAGYGNYWCDWANNNDTNDRNGDGIVDWPYPIAGSAGAKDPYPLKYPEGFPPTPPRNLTARAGDGWVNLSWKPPLDDRGSPVNIYRIYRNNLPLANVSAEQCWYNDTSVINYWVYTYCVTALNSVAESVKSKGFEIMPCSVPEPPRILTAKGGDGWVNLSWEPPEGDGAGALTEYRIYRDGTFISSVPARIHWYNDTSVVNGKTYSYCVTALNPCFESPPSPLIYVTPSRLPTPPQNLRAAPGDGFVLLSWIPPYSNGGANITEYRIYRGLSSHTLSCIASSHTNSYNDSDVQNGLRYFYRVSAVNPAGESEPSNIVSVIPMSPPEPPQNLTAKSGVSFILLSWNPPLHTGGGGITGYNIYRSTDNSTFIYYGHTSSDITTFQDDIVTVGQRYFYYVTALNLIGESPPSNILSAVPAAPPSPPINVNARSGNSFILLRWDEPEDNGGLPVKEYRIYRGLNSVILSLLTTLTPDSHHFNDTDVQNGIIYYYYITATNRKGESSPSRIVSAKPVGPPAPPENLTATAGDSFVLLTWDPPMSNGGEEIISYRIYRGESEENLTLLVEVLPSVYTYNDMTVKNGKTYYYRITAANRLYEGSPTPTIMVKPTQPPQYGDQNTPNHKEEKNLSPLIAILIITSILSLTVVYLYLKGKIKLRKDKP